MKNKLLNLQLFADGAGDGAGAAAGTTSFTDVGGTVDTAEGAVAKPVKGRNSLSDVVYGTQATQGDDNQATGAVTTQISGEQAKSFDDLIKGEYKEDFTNKVSEIINERMKKVSEVQNQMKSLDPVLELLSSKYGVDAKDTDALIKAVEEDSTFYEEEASKKGLSVEQLKSMKALERENAQFRQTLQEAQRKEEGEKLYSGWLQQANVMAQKYGLENFDLQGEIQSNPDFVAILRNNGTVEAAYKATHMDEILSSSMARTAEAVRADVTKGIQAKASRPNESAVNSQAPVTVKTDVSKLDKKDMKEIERRVMAGEKISF